MVGKYKLLELRTNPVFDAVTDGIELLDFPLGGFAVSNLLLFAPVVLGVFFFLFLYIFFSSFGSTGSAKYSSSVESRLKMFA